MPRKRNPSRGVRELTRALEEQNSVNMHLQIMLSRHEQERRWEERLFKLEQRLSILEKELYDVIRPLKAKTT